MLDKELVQKQLDEVSQQYANGLITLWEKLHKMVEIVDNHVDAHKIAQQGIIDGVGAEKNQYEKAHSMINQMRHIDRFLAKLNFYI